MKYFVGMNRSLRTITILLLAAAVLAACATSPTGRRQLMLVSEESAIASSSEAYVSTVQEFAKEGKLFDNPATNERVKVITGRLITEAIKMRPDTADWEWSVVIVDEPETVNAWCMAGGRMAVYTGLLQKVDPTDDELAQVMGHEISHALANHSAEKMSMQMASSIGVAAAGIFSDNKGIAVSGAALAARYAVNMPNSRSAETEADRIGIELAAKAGYDPRAAVTLWQKMAEEGGQAPPQFLSTHPNPANRQKTLADLGPEMMQYYDPGAPHAVYPL